MIISWYGEGCFKIQSGDTTIVTDPVDSKSGLTAPRGKIDIVIKSLSSWPLRGGDDKSESKQTFIEGAGHYEIKSASIEGWPLEKESSDKFLKTVYKIDWDDIKIGFLGHLSGEMDSETQGCFKEMDVLIIPAGGKPFLEQAAAAKLVKKLAPKSVIPAFFKVPGLKRSSAAPQTFLKELNRTGAKTEEKFSFRKKDLADQKMKIVLLKP